MRYVLLFTEGPHDIEFLGKILETAAFIRLREKSKIDPFWTNAIPTKYPLVDDLEERMPTPVFYQTDGVSLAIKGAKGIDNIARVASETIKLLDPIDSIGFFLDADSKIAAATFFEFKEQLSKHPSLREISFKDGVGKVSPGPPRNGCYVFPDNSTPGSLEYILEECAKLHYPKLLQRAQDFVGNISLNELIAKELKPLDKPQGRKKAALCCVGTILKPAQTIQASIRSDRWITGSSLNNPMVSDVRDFLLQLIESAP